MKDARKPVLLTVRHGHGRTPARHAVELPDGTPVAGVASVVMGLDTTGAPVLTIQLRRFSVDVEESDPAPYAWQDLGVLALPHHRS
ncbi:MAG: hypothetical protein ACRYHA_17780 [Janthinobacterium lividum]